MAKKVLVAEASDAVRHVVEGLLRQNGYDVIGVSGADRAAEVLQFGRPDLIVTGGELVDSGQRAFYDQLQSDPRTSSIPLLVIEPPDKSSVSLPPEVVIPRPVEPGDFLQRVHIFLGQVSNAPKKAAPKPAPTLPVDDAFLDAALGIDRIDVTASEDMDKTSTGRVGKKKAVPIETPFAGNPDDDAMGDSRKVEMLSIRDSSGDIKPQNTKPPHRVDGSGTGKIELVRDQYGMTDPSALHQQVERQVHDYDWFVNSMRDDASGLPKNPPPGKSVSDSQKLKMTETSSIIDPITPATAAHPAVGGGKNRVEGVEKFIDEFKKEIELLRSRETDPPIAETSALAKPVPAGVSWKEEIESMSVEQLRPFAKDLTAMLAERIAERIVSKIDSERLMALVKEELSSISRKK